ncbi:hemin uptake protein HemP [Bosea sp. (in: a-proteobacteria)]
MTRPAAMRPVRTVASAAVFKGETEIGIEHHGELYRLRITRQGKLILTK